MSFFKPTTRFDKIFEIGILLKGLDGLLETVGGILLLLAKPDRINSLALKITHTELRAEPHDFLATHFLHWAQQLTRAGLVFGGLYLLIHGVAKLVLVFEIFRNHLWAYIGLIVLTGLFIVYQTYEIIFSQSISLILLDIFDIAIIYLTIREYKKQRLLHQNKPEHDS